MMQRICSGASLLCLLLGAANAAAQDTPPSAMLEVSALHAHEDPQAAPLPSALRGIRELLADTPYNAFSPVAQHALPLLAGQSHSLRLGEHYTLHARVGEAPEDGGMPLEVRIEDAGGLTAVRAAGLAQPGRPLLFRDLAMPEGELIVALRITQEGPGQGDAGEDSPPDERDDSPGDAQQPESGEDEESEAPDQDEADSDSERDPDGAPEGEDAPAMQDELPLEIADSDSSAPPQDLDNVEALLRSLAEVDDREQRNARRERGAIRIRSEWW